MSIPLRLGVIAGLALLLAMAAVGSRARIGAAPSAGPAGLRLGFEALEFLSVAALLAGLALLVMGFPRLRRRRPDDEPEWVVERPPVPWYTKLLLLGLIVLLMALLGGSLLLLRGKLEERQVAPASTGPSFPAAPGSLPPRPAGPPAAGGSPLAPVVWAVVAVAVVAGGWAMGPWVRSRGRRALPQRRLVPGEPVLEEALRLGLEDLRREPDPRRAIVAAYARMLAVLGRLGIRRGAAEAPIEYLRRLLRELEGDAEPVRRLTELFELAEFSRQPMTEALRAEAIAALEAVRGALGSARVTRAAWWLVAGGAAHTAVAGLLLAALPGHRAGVVDAWLLGVAVLGVAAGAVAARHAAGRTRPPVPTRRSPQVRRPAELERLERELVLMRVSGMHARQVQLRLRRVAAASLAVRHGIDLDGDPDRAASLLGPSTWALLDVMSPSAARDATPMDLTRLRAAVEAVEALERT